MDMSSIWVLNPWVSGHNWGMPTFWWHHICRNIYPLDGLQKDSVDTDHHDIFWMLNYPNNNTGWWYLPLWKIWKSIGMMTFSIYGKKEMFQTTNQNMTQNCTKYNPTKDGPNFRKNPEKGKHPHDDRILAKRKNVRSLIYCRYIIKKQYLPLQN